MLAHLFSGGLSSTLNYFRPDGDESPGCGFPHKLAVSTSACAKICIDGAVALVQATERFKERQIPGPKPYYATKEWPSLWFEPVEVWEARALLLAC